MIKEKEVWVGLGGSAAKHYESLGYEIPKRVDQFGKLKFEIGTKILVKIEDIPRGSGMKVTKVCDICGKHVPQSYQLIIRDRERTKDGLDRCIRCSSSENGKKRGLTNEDECIAFVKPELVNLFWNQQDAFLYKPQSGKTSDFKCPTCGHKIKNKRIQSILNEGLFCPYCSDNISFPEKVMLNLLKELKINFNYQQYFKEWYKKGDKKFYDFYLPGHKIIVEMHGLQHYEGGFETYGKGAKNKRQEKENDLFKKETAISNGILEENYIEIDSSYSSIDYIKNSIIKSKLSTILDLSFVNWNKINEKSLKTLVKDVCDLWNEGNKIEQICETTKLDRQTIRKYLKRGSEMQWCIYDPKLNKGFIKESKSIVQLTIEGKFIKEWESLSKTAKSLNVSRYGITEACNNNQERYNSLWMYKSDYDQFQKTN